MTKAEESSAANPALLSLESISVSFGQLEVVHDVSLSVGEREICGLIGPNGAGKSTLFDVMTGFVHPRRGRVLFDGRDITRHNPARRARAGLRRSFQDGELFEDLSVRENALVGCRRRETSDVEELLNILRLKEVADRSVGDLPAGLRLQAGVLRAFARSPRLVLLDEPGSGLIEHEVERLSAMIRECCVVKGCALVLVAHDFNLIRSICDMVYVLEFGSVIAVGSPRDVEGNERVRSAYLGV
jgi:branched-chain amino acid transport system ATP-binding protein